MVVLFYQENRTTVTLSEEIQSNGSWISKKAYDNKEKEKNS